MSLRMVEILVPANAGAEVDALLADAELLDRWQEPTMDDRVLVRLLARAEQCESILDAFEQRFGTNDRFRAVIVALQAVVPRPAEPEPEPEPAPAPKPKKLFHRVSREELLADLEPGTKVDPIFLVTVVLSTIVAGVGLVQDSVAVIIGAMVIAPLLTPNMSLALATTLGDVGMIRKSLRTNLVGLGLAAGLSLLVGLTFDVHPGSEEIAARTDVSPSDLLLALASGCAGALAFTSGVSAGLVGVMVAVALLPPLTTAGMLLGAGELKAGGGALALLATNIICVNLAGVATFAAQGVRPRTWWEADKAKRATRRAFVIWTALFLVLTALVVLFAGPPASP